MQASVRLISGTCDFRPAEELRKFGIRTGDRAKRICQNTAKAVMRIEKGKRRIKNKPLLKIARLDRKVGAAVDDCRV